MKKLINKVTIYLFGVETYSDNIDNIIDNYTPTFRTLIPEGYNANSIDAFNSWGENIYTLLRTK